jgi:hypothetical protein
METILLVQATWTKIAGRKAKQTTHTDSIPGGWLTSVRLSFLVSNANSVGEFCNFNLLATVSRWLER